MTIHDDAVLEESKLTVCITDRLEIVPSLLQVEAVREEQGA